MIVTDFTHTDDNIIFGTRTIIETVLSGNPVSKIFIYRFAQSPLHKKLINMLKKHAIPYSFVPIEKLNRITKKNHQGVIAVVSPLIFSSISDIVSISYEQRRFPFLVLLDGVTDVHNLGAIVRTAVCAGVDALVIPMQGSALLGGGAMKTSAGALSKLPICRVHDLKESICYLQEMGIQIIACHEKKGVSPYVAELYGPLALLFGSEERGIRLDYLALAHQHISIPMMGSIESLNVSVAAAIIMYECVRQRNTHPSCIA